MQEDKDERPADIREPDDEDVERRIDHMLDPNLPDEAEPSTAPEIRKGSKKISVLHAHEDELSTAPEIKAKTKSKAAQADKPESDDLKKAIEETNAELAKVIPVLDDTEEPPLEASDTTEELKPPVSSEDTISLKEPEALLPERFEDEPTDADESADEQADSETDTSDPAEAAMPVSIPEEPVKHPSRLRKILKDLLHSKGLRWVVFFLLLGVVGAAGAIPVTRYYALNMAGVRSSASIQVIDQSTLQPLKDVTVQLAGQSAMTDDEGTARFTKLRLGATGLTIQKRAFAPINEQVVIGWGSNPLGSRNVTPVGSQYTFNLTDFLSGKPVAKAAASAGDADARSDDKGQVRLTMEHDNATTIEVTIVAAGYRDEKITLDLNSKQVMALKMVPARKQLFISKRSGTYDVYKVDVDGKNETLVLKGTGNERDDMVLASHPTDEVAVLVSTHDNKRNADGFLLSSLTLINVNDNSTKMVTQSEQIKLVNWIGDRLVYVQIAAGASAANPTRQRLMSYDYKTLDNRQIAASNYFNDVTTAGGKIYYAPSSTYQTAGNGASLFRIGADGKNKQTILAQETWSIFRLAYDRIVLSVPNSWYEYPLEATAPTKLEGQPGNLTPRVYVDGPDGKNSLWVDNRDGKGVLLLYDIITKTDKVLQTLSGLKLPIRWLNDRTVVYRVHSAQETADYAVSLDGGEPVKIRDVTDTGGIDKWYYY